MTGETTFWEGVAARVRPVGVAATVENPQTLVRITTGALWFSVASSGFSAVVFFWFGEPAAGLASVALSAAYLGAWFWFATTGSVFGVLVIVVAASSTQILFIHINLGGYANSGAYLMWSIAQVLSAALVFRRNVTIAIAGFYTTIAIVFGFLEQTLQANRPAPDPTLPAILFPLILIGNLWLLGAIFISLLGRLSHERERAEGLLLNVLPEVVASELKERGEVAARRYAGISVLFADIVGFTPLSAEMEPEEMVSQLNDVFTYFDTLAERYGCEKIRTIGDNYMVASGVPVPRDDHAQALAAMALDMLEYSETGPLSFRLGITSGPAVAGVIGTKKFQYDIWGDTVNTASRMESHGEPNKIQISQATHDLIAGDFATTPRGPIEVKGKGTLDTWWLASRRIPTPA